MSCFQTNLDSAYSIMVIAFVFGAILENARFQRALNIAILAHHLE